MAQGESAISDSSGQQAAEGHGAGSTSEEERGRFEEGDRSSGGNRWPRQETVALIKIRSDMDVVFRDSSHKGPLWEEVSRKLGELGYHRSAKKCKEKFENVYKYHKRTKEGRTSKADGKTYRFFDQLEALEANPTVAMPFSQVTLPSVVNSGSHQNNVNPISVAAPINHVVGGGFSFPLHNMSGSISSSTSSSDDDDDHQEPPEVRAKRKRKWKDFFGKLTNEVIHKQEELHMKFLDRLEKRERQQMEKEEAWRMQEMAKMNQEHDLLVQERSIAAAKDAAVLTFLHKITQQQHQENQPPPMQQQPQHQSIQPAPAPAPVPAPALALVTNQPVKNRDINGGGENLNTNSKMVPASPARWPKAEVDALINLRTKLDIKYHDNVPKGPLWEEISAAMVKLGYNRNAKRCKEKWENINKYYKKVKENSKKRPDHSKTCPYFHQLDAIYREKANNRPQMAPIMAEPEQQWPLASMVVQQQQKSSTVESENMDQNNEDDYEDDDKDEEDEGGEN